MKPWKDRPAEISNLLNPAFCGEIIRRTALKYQSEKKAPLPFLFAFLILPLLADKLVRSKIPNLGAPKLHVWIEENPELRIGLSSKIEQFSPLTKEALLFLSRHSCISFDGSGNIIVNMTSRSSIINHEEIKHPHNFYKKAEKLGMWFSSSGGPLVTFAALGVKV